MDFYRQEFSKRNNHSFLKCQIYKMG